MVRGLLRLMMIAVAVPLCGAGASQASDMVLGRRLFEHTGVAHVGLEMSCLSCHPEATRLVGEAARPASSYHGGARNAVLERTDRQRATVRNSPSLLDALVGGSQNLLLHYDGEFASAEELVRETFVGRNFGWLPKERGEALRRLAAVARAEIGAAAAELSEEAVVEHASRSVAEFVRTLRFSRDRDGRYNGSAYDAFLRVNRLPLAPEAGQSAAEYGAKLGEQAAALRAPRFVADAHGVVRFGEAELKGMRIFFRGAVGENQRSGAGNCAECHVPPSFTDLKFHNTGATQDEYDAVHGVGAFARLAIPSLAEREREPERWLRATAGRPEARGTFFAVVEVGAPQRVDLGVWNVYANADFAAPQAALERTLNPAGQRSRAEVLEMAVARFKTTTVRNLAPTAPYLHTGHAATIEEAVEFYRKMSDLAREGKLRNAPPEYFAMRLAQEDVAPLAAFLRALDEGFVEKGSGVEVGGSRVGN